MSGTPSDLAPEAQALPGPAPRQSLFRCLVNLRRWNSLKQALITPGRVPTVRANGFTGTVKYCLTLT